MDLKYCLKKLDEAGKLAHIKSEVDVYHEMAGISAKLEGKIII